MGLKIENKDLWSKYFKHWTNSLRTDIRFSKSDNRGVCIAIGRLVKIWKISNLEGMIIRYSRVGTKEFNYYIFRYIANVFDFELEAHEMKFNLECEFMDFENACRKVNENKTSRVHSIWTEHRRCTRNVFGILKMVCAAPTQVNCRRDSIP